MVRLQTISVACNVDSTYGGETVRGRFLGFVRNGGKGRDLSDVRRRVFSGPLWAVRFPLEAGCLWPLLPARHPPPEWGWAGETRCSAFFSGLKAARWLLGTWEWI